MMALQRAGSFLVSKTSSTPTFKHMSPILLSPFLFDTFQVSQEEVWRKQWKPQAVVQYDVVLSMPPAYNNLTMQRIFRLCPSWGANLSAACAPTKLSKKWSPTHKGHQSGGGNYWIRMGVRDWSENGALGPFGRMETVNLLILGFWPQKRTQFFLGPRFSDFRPHIHDHAY